MSPLLTVPQAAQVLNVRLTTLKKLLSTRRIASYQVSGCVRIAQADIDAYLAANRREAIADVIALHPSGRATRSKPRRFA